MTLLRSELAGAAPFVSLRVRARLDECTLKPWLDRVVADHPDVSIGSYPQWPADAPRTDVTFDAPDAAPAERARDAFVALLPAGALVKEGE